jgi:hypothetical protein
VTTRLPDAVMLLTAALVYGAVAQGAFYPVKALTLAGLAALAAGVLRTRVPRRALVAFGALAVGLAVSFALEPDGDARVAASVLVIAAAATWIGASQRSTFMPVAGLLVAVGAAAALAGIAGAALHHEPLALEAQGIWRAASTLTYANSLGAVLVPCLAAGAMRLRERDGLLDRLGVAAIVSGLVASISRAAFVSLVVGIVVAIVVDRRGTVRAVVASRTAIVAGAIGGLGVLPSIFGEPSPVLAALGIVAGALVCVPPPASRIGAVVTIGAALAVAAGGIVATTSGRLDGIGERLVNEDRARIWNVSYDAGVAALPTGQGLERFQVFETRPERTFRIRYAHNEALQAFVETGVVGPVAYALAFVLLASVLWSRRHGAGLELGVAAAFLTHGMLDFVWHVPVVALLDFLFVGAALGPRQDAGSGSPIAGGSHVPSQLNAVWP